MKMKTIIPGQIIMNSNKKNITNEIVDSTINKNTCSPSKINLLLIRLISDHYKISKTALINNQNVTSNKKSNLGIISSEWGQTS